MLDTADRSRVAELTEREERTFRNDHPRSLELAERAKRSLLAGVPMHWMAKWPGGVTTGRSTRRSSRSAMGESSHGAATSGRRFRST